MAFAEDLTPFFTDFALPATVGGVAVLGIFDNGYGVGLGIVAGSAPLLTVEATVTTTIGAAVSVAGGSYTIAEIKPDGSGLKLLVLEEV